MNIDDLIQPISAPSPCGDDLSFSSAFDTIRDLRREDDATLAQGEWVAAHKVADWPGVVAACAALLRTSSKDLRLAGWWAEARTRVDGFAGLDDGLALVTRLVSDDWDGVHPQIENGDADARIGSLQWLLSQIPRLAESAPLAPSLHGVPVTLQEAQAARLRQQAVTRGSLDAVALKAEGALLPDDIQRHVAAQPAGALQASLAALSSVQARLVRLQAELDARLGDDSPGFGAAAKALESAVDAVQRLGRESGVLPAEAPGKAGPGIDSEGGDAGVDRSGGGVDDASVTGGPAPLAGPVASPPGAPLQTRAQALHQLREVGAFFRRTEPHSPVAYLADKAARWGDMPLHAWLRAVVKDGGSLAHLEEMLGIEPPPQQDG